MSEPRSEHEPVDDRPLVTVPMPTAAFAGRCRHGMVVAGASIRTEHIDDIGQWQRDGLTVSVESPVRIEWCDDCLGKRGSDV